MFNLKKNKTAQVDIAPIEPTVPATEPALDTAISARNKIEDLLKKKMSNLSELEGSLDNAYVEAIKAPEVDGDSENAYNLVKSVLVDLFPEKQEDISDALRSYLDSEEGSVENQSAKNMIYDIYSSKSLADPEGKETSEKPEEIGEPSAEITEPELVSPVESAPETSMGEPAMPEAEMIPVAFNMKTHKNSDKTASLKKEAGGWGGGHGSHAILYGPEEKRYCPKLRNVISLFNCRFYCIDGLMVDDYRILCGEAVWRQNIMDKFSRAYRDADGKYVGGYIDKRFEVHHDTESPQYQLKPGQRRRPLRPDEFSVERRMDQQREGKLPDSIAPKEVTAETDSQKKK